jgi:Mg2+ and Co2+ transporter CorA
MAFSDFATIRRTWISEHERHAGVFTGMIIAHHISEFGSRKSGFPSTLDIFESGIAQILTEVDAYMDPNTLSRPELKKEHDFMFRIADIREELAMIKQILGQQFEILGNLIDDVELNNTNFTDNILYDCWGTGKNYLKTSKGWEEVKRSKIKLNNYQKQVDKIDGDAERVEKRIQDQLNLKRTHVSINDARTSLILGTAVIGFTVITVIFAPLAFMTALFALPLDILLTNQFQFGGTGDNSDGIEGAQRNTAAYSTRYVATWFGERFFLFIFKS